MMHDVELTDEQIAYMCHAHEVNMPEVFDNGEDWQTHYSDVRGSPMERFKMATKEGRRIWDMIPPEDKNIFAGITPQLHPQCVTEDPKAADPKAADGEETEANMGVTFGDEDIDETTDNEDEPLQVTSALSTIDNCFDHDIDDQQDNDPPGSYQEPRVDDIG